MSLKDELLGVLARSDLAGGLARPNLPLEKLDPLPFPGEYLVAIGWKT